MSTPNFKTAPAAEPAPAEPTAESLGWQLRAALPPIRLHSVSLYDHAGEVLWLSEGALGPDEHGFVVEALGALTEDSASSHRESDLQDGRGAVFLAIRSPQAELVGLVMILVDAKALSAGGLAARILAPPVKALVQRLAILLRPAPKPSPMALVSDGSAPKSPPIAIVADSHAPKSPPIRAGGRSASPSRSEAKAHSAAVAARTSSSSASTPTSSSTSSSSTSSSSTTSSSTAASSATAPAAGAPSAGGSSASHRNLEIIEWSPPEPPSAAGAENSGEITVDVLGPKAIDDILTFDLADDAPRGPGSSGPHARPIDPLSSAASGRPRHAGETEVVSFETEPVPAHATASLPAADLYIRELGKLRPGGRTRRFQLQSKRVASGEPAERAVIGALRELAAWLDIHAPGEERGTLHFSIAVPAEALAAEDLAHDIGDCIRATGLAPDCIGFELAESACVRQRQHAERFVHALERLGCHLVLDDFAFDSGALELLRSKALRLVKVEGALTAAALRDKLAQARIVAISQAARVLGIHCAAKQVDAPATQRWLAAAGFDFAEGSVYGGARPIAALASELAERR